MSQPKPILVDETRKDLLSINVPVLSITPTPLGGMGDIWYTDDEANVMVIIVTDMKSLKQQIFDGSIFQTAANILEMTPWAYMLIGNSYPREPLIPAIRGAQITLQEMGFCVYDYSGKTEDELAYLLHRDRNPVRGDPRRDYVVATDGEAILMSIPGIGPSKAAVLLEEYGSVWSAIMALVDPDEKIPTVSNEQRSKILNAFGLEE